MAGTRIRLTWRIGEVVETRTETPRARSLLLEAPGWEGHRAGQHVDVRLTAEDGYQAQRSYSIASAPEDGRLEIVVERLDDGEVSPYLTDELRVGDRLELRGPIGGWFTWEAREGGPLLLVGGGSGVVPLMAMLRHHAATKSTAAVHLVYSVRTPRDVLYASELERLAGLHRALTITATREAPPGWGGRRGRIDRQLISDVGWPATARPRCYVCGPTPFVEAMATALKQLGHGADDVRTERFGPTGG